MKKIKWTISIILLIIIVFVFWKREPWVKTFTNQQECENSTKKNCVHWLCDYVQTTFWLDCPHGGAFWTPAK